MTLFSTRRRTAAVALTVLAGAAVAVPLHASAAETARATCTATIDYTAAPTDAATYTQTFTVTAAAPFVDDRSTALRQEVFTATIVGSEVQVGYFKDVNVLDNIDLDVNVALTGGRGAASGRSTFSTSNQPNHSTAYTVTCRR